MYLDYDPIELYQKKQQRIVNGVLRDTYALVAMTLIFSGFTAAIAALTEMPPLGPLITLGGYLGLLFITYKMRDSNFGIISVFVLTGFIGLTLGPLLSAYWSVAQPTVFKVLASTALVFASLSGYALLKKQDVSFLDRFLFVAFIAALTTGLSAYLFELPVIALAASTGFVLVVSAIVLYQTSNIVKGGQHDYVFATVALFVSILTMFVPHNSVRYSRAD